MIFEILIGLAVLLLVCALFTPLGKLSKYFAKKFRYWPSDKGWGFPFLAMFFVFVLSYASIYDEENEMLSNVFLSYFYASTSIFFLPVYIMVAHTLRERRKIHAWYMCEEIKDSKQDISSEK